MAHSVIDSVVLLWTIMVLGAAAQAPPNPTASAMFEVASIKPNQSGNAQMVIRTPPSGLVVATNVSVVMLLRYAYDIPEFRIVSLPPWASSDHFDVTARGRPDAPADETKAMLRNLLADRFSVMTRAAKQELGVGVLTMAGAAFGPQLRRAERACTRVPATAAERAAAQAAGGTPCGLRVAFGRISGTDVPIGDLATALVRLERRQIVDETALQGRYDFTLTYTPDAIALDPSTRGDFPAIDPDGPALSTALQEQLGLRLRSARRVVDVLIVDQIRPPTAD